MSSVSSRREWVDALRGLAVVGMVWTHCANTFLDINIQETEGYATASYYHGLVAPTFFWLAGLMRGMAAARPGPRKPAWPTVKRLLSILCLAYLMHVPWSAWMKGNFSPDAWRIFVQADVLHCLALSSLLLLALERTGRAVWWLAAGLMIGVLYLTDFVQERDSGLALVDAYLSRRHGSLFPLFPWLAFALAGFLCGRRRFGFIQPAVGFILAFGIPFIPGDHTTRTFFFERLGWVLLVAGVMCYVWPWLERKVPMATKGLGWLTLAGRESLVAYVVHLVLIYALPVAGGQTLAVWMGTTQSLAAVAGWFIGVLSVTLLITWLKSRRWWTR